MVRQITAYLLLIAFILQSFQTGLYYLDYYRNRSDYAKDCINKLRPYLHCNGQCQLMKKILQHQKKEEQEKKEDTRELIQVFAPPSFITGAACCFDPLKPGPGAGHSEGKTCDRSYPVFHPPGISAVST